MIEVVDKDKHLFDTSYSYMSTFLELGAEQPRSGQEHGSPVKADRTRIAQTAVSSDICAMALTLNPKP